MKFRTYLPNGPELWLIILQRVALLEQYKFRSSARWRASKLICGGLYRRQLLLLGTQLRVRDNQCSFLEDIADRWVDCPLPPMTLQDVNQYQKQLQEHNNVLSCNETHRYLMEGFYPIDCSQEAIKLLSNSRVPADPDDFLYWENDRLREAGAMSRWTLAVLVPPTQRT